MMPASPPPAPMPWRTPRNLPTAPVPVLWLGTGFDRPLIPAVTGKRWMH